MERPTSRRRDRKPAYRVIEVRLPASLANRLPVRERSRLVAEAVRNQIYQTCPLCYGYGCGSGGMQARFAAFQQAVDKPAPVADDLFSFEQWKSMQQCCPCCQTRHSASACRLADHGYGIEPGCPPDIGQLSALDMVCKACDHRFTLVEGKVLKQWMRLLEWRAQLKAAKQST